MLKHQNMKNKKYNVFQADSSFLESVCRENALLSEVRWF